MYLRRALIFICTVVIVIVFVSYFASTPIP